MILDIDLLLLNYPNKYILKRIPGSGINKVGKARRKGHINAQSDKWKVDFFI